MNTLPKNIKELVLNIRKEWMKKIVYGYQISDSKLWKYYGYESYDSFRHDLTE